MSLNIFAHHRNLSKNITFDMNEIFWKYFFNSRSPIQYSCLVVYGSHSPIHEITSLCWNYSVATLALGLQPRQRLTRLRAKQETREPHLILLGMQRVWGNEPSHSQVTSHFGSWSPNELLNLQRVIARVKTHWFEEFFTLLKRYWNLDV